jgi:hypothetical protein
MALYSPLNALDLDQINTGGKRQGCRGAGEQGRIH